MKKILVAGLYTFAQIATVLSSSFASAEDAPIKLISSLPRTGSANAQTSTVVNGIKMAIAEAEGKVIGLPIVYEDWDDASPEKGQWDPAVESANADKAIQDPDIMAYIGTYNSGAAKIAMPKLNKAGLLMISPGNSWPGLTKPGMGDPSEPMMYRPSGKITYFRVFPTDDVQGPSGAQWAKDLGFKKVYVLNDRELYGKGLAELFKRAAEKIGVQVVGFEGIDPKASNYKSLITKIKQTGAELVYFGGTTQTNAGQLAKDLKSFGGQIKLMVPDGCFETALITSAGADALNDRVFITFPGTPPSRLTGQGKIFYDAYKAKYGSEPEAFAIYGYEATKVTLDAITRAGKKDREAILEAIRTTKDFKGALGTWSFDANGDITLTSLSGNTVKDGKFEFLTSLEVKPLL